MNRKIRAFDANTGSYGRTISDDDEPRYLNDDGSTVGSGSFRPAKDDVPQRELPARPREAVASLYDAFREGSDDYLDLTEQQLLDLIAARAREHAQGSPERAAALNRVAQRIAQHQDDWDKLSHRDQVDSWHMLMLHETGAPRRRDGGLDVASLEQQALAAAGRGSLDLSAHPETRLRGRDLRAEYDAEKTAGRGNQ